MWFFQRDETLIMYVWWLCMQMRIRKMAWLTMSSASVLIDFIFLQVNVSQIWLQSMTTNTWLAWRLNQTVCSTRILSMLLGLMWMRWIFSACTHLLSSQESELRCVEPAHVTNVQERAEMLAAKLTGQSDKPDKPQVEQHNDGLTNSLALFSLLVLHGLGWFFD